MALRITERIAAWLIRARVAVVVLIALLTAFFAYSAMHMHVETLFDDLMPKKHPYVKVHQEFKQSFGGSNMVSIMLRVKDGDIFDLKVLGTIQHIQRDLRMVTGVNEFQIISLASQKLRNVKAGTYGIERKPLMWPYLPKNQEEIEKLKEKVLSNRMVYGSYVSLDLRAALISVDFIENKKLNFNTISRQINEIVDRYRTEGLQISVVGEPILQGLIHSYFPETVRLFVGSIGVLGLLLFVLFMRSLRGTFVPLLAAVVSAIWAFGIANMLGMNFDPLGVVIAFLITARVISHSVQSVNRFDIIITEGAETSIAAAQASLTHLFKPGLLSVITDAGGILVVAMAPIPMLQKVAVIAAIWVSCISVTGVVLTPVLLSWVRKPQHYLNPFDMSPLIVRMLSCFASLVTSRFRYVFFFGALVAVIVCGYIGIGITIGDANPGSPLLWQDSDYNIAVSEINSRFLGTDRMFFVFRGCEKDTLKEPEVLSNMQRFQRHIERQPEIGGSNSIADILPSVKRVLYEDNPRFEEIGQEKNENAELLYMYLAGSQPGDLAQVCDVNYKNAGINLYLRDHKGSTIRTALSRIKRFIKNNPLPDGKYELCGGLIGVLAAVNEVIFSGQVESVALAFFVVLFTSAIAYRSGVAGLYFMLPILLSNTITFAYMALKGIGLNINSLPVAALGIGLGVDYSIYLIDAIKEEYMYHGNLKDAIHHSLNNAGRGIVFTATPLVFCTFFWYIFSPLRFQAEMALLIAVWMFVSAISALIVMPPIVYILRPRFVVGDEPHYIQA
ncbi:MAG: efflux RND transporter permease subunit [Dissulfuribacterales bacterium]